MATSTTLKIYRGVTFKRKFHYYTPPNTDVNISGRTMVFKIQRPGLPDYVLETGQVPNAQGSQFVITNAVQGRCTLTITDEDTTLFTFNGGTWWLGLNGLSDINRIASGKIVVTNP